MFVFFNIADSSSTNKYFFLFLKLVSITCLVELKSIRNDIIFKMLRVCFFINAYGDNKKHICIGKKYDVNKVINIHLIIILLYIEAKNNS